MPTFDVFVAYMPWMSFQDDHDCHVPPGWFAKQDATSAKAAALRYALTELSDVALRSPRRTPAGLVVVPHGHGLYWSQRDIEAAQAEAEQQRLEDEERAESLRLKAKYEP